MMLWEMIGIYCFANVPYLIYNLAIVLVLWQIVYITVLSKALWKALDSEEVQYELIFLFINEFKSDKIRLN